MKFSIGALVLIGLGFTFGASTGSDGEKREMPSGFAYNMYRTGGDTTQFGTGGYTTTVLGQGQGQGQGQNVAYTTVVASDRQGSSQQMPPMPSGMTVAFGPSAPTQNANGGPPYPPYSFKDPGFSVQTGFEGFLVPNPWYGAISWGIETIVIAGIAIAFILALGAGAIFLLFKIARFGKFFKDDEGGDGDVGARSYIPSVFNQENLGRLTTSVMNALDRYNEIIREESGEE